MASIGILGAGSWGTALAVLLGNKGHQVGALVPQGRGGPQAGPGQRE